MFLTSCGKQKTKDNLHELKSSVSRNFETVTEPQFVYDKAQEGGCNPAWALSTDWQFIQRASLDFFKSNNGQTKEQ